MKNSFKSDTLELTTILVFIFFFSFILNFFWEALHAVYLYQRHDFDASNYVPMLIYVSSVDSLIVLGLYLGVGVMWLDLFMLKMGPYKNLVKLSLKAKPLPKYEHTQSTLNTCNFVGEKRTNSCGPFLRKIQSET